MVLISPEDMEFQRIIALLKGKKDNTLVWNMLLRPGRQDCQTEPGSHLTDLRMGLRGQLHHTRLKSRLLEETRNVILPAGIEPSRCAYPCFLSKCRQRNSWLAGQRMIGRESHNQ